VYGGVRSNNMTVSYICKNNTVKKLRLTKLYDTIKVCKPCNLEIREIVTSMPKNKKFECGSAGCVIGHMPIAFPRHFNWIDLTTDEGFISIARISSGKSFTFWSLYDEVACFFGIRIEQAHFICDPYYYPSSLLNGPKHLVKKEVLRRIKSAF
jgi:hypothetical protein